MEGGISGGVFLKLFGLGWWEWWGRRERGMEVGEGQG